MSNLRTGDIFVLSSIVANFEGDASGFIEYLANMVHLTGNEIWDSHFEDFLHLLDTVDKTQIIEII